MFILAILLLMWNTQIELNEAGFSMLSNSYSIGQLVFGWLQSYMFIEHYAGSGVMTETLREQYPAAKLDIEYGRGMDICTSAEFGIQP